MHPKGVARLQGAFDGILQQQFTESLSADGEGSREATDPHSRYLGRRPSHRVPGSIRPPIGGMPSQAS
jgi:hypothetical protein